MTALLDVNVLIALLDGDHVHAAAAHDWFGREAESGWATCPLTQNAVLRIVGHSRYPNSPGGPGVVADLLEPLLANPHHVFWPDDVSVLDGSRFVRMSLGSAARLTDACLLALAVKNGGRLATFDAKLSPDAVVGGREALLLL